MPATTRSVSYERSARRDLRFWGLFLIGLVFVYGGFTIDPQTNCSEGGECAPILVPIAAGLGLLAMLGGLAQLIANPSRGSVLDPGAGTLTWWQNRSTSRPGDGGSIALDRIARILITRDSEGDEISLYDSEGERLHFFDSEVIPWRIDEWSEALRKANPAITIEERG